MHTHITRDERAVISNGVFHGESYREIACRVGRNVSSISREVRRNRNASGGYSVPRAHQRAKTRRQYSKTQTRLIENDPTLERRIEEVLDPLTPPEMIAHREGIHHQTIYSWILRSRPDLKQQLPRRGRKRKSGGKRGRKSWWTGRVRDIDERPDTQFSWEGDTVKGCTRSQLLTHVERRSLFTVIDLLEEGSGIEVSTKTVMRGFDGAITYDRGGEFAYWDLTEKDLGTKIYFAHPYHPWERGKNENTNGRIRRVFPKRFNFSTITQRDVEELSWKMNHTPRKSLSWQTPCAVYGRCCDSG